MRVICSGEAKILLKSTDETFVVRAEELEWNAEPGEEREQGRVVRHWATYKLISAQTDRTYDLTWQVWEYPEGVEERTEVATSYELNIIENLHWHLA